MDNKNSAAAHLLVEFPDDPAPSRFKCGAWKSNVSVSTAAPRALLSVLLLLHLSPHSSFAVF